MLSDIGIGPAIINERKFTYAQRDGIFSFTLILGLSIAFIFYLFSFFLNYFYGDYEYQSMALIVAVSIFFNALCIVPKTSLVKDAKFICIAKIDIISEIFGFVFVFIILEFFNESVLSLTSRILFISLFKYLLTTFYSKSTELGMPKLNRDFSQIKTISGFATYQFGFNFINYFSRNLDNILVGKFLGMGSLGIYDKSYQLMRYPLMVTTYAMTPAIQPILTKFRDNKEVIVREHNILSKRLLLLSVLISSFLYINAEDVTWVIFGSQWGDVVPLIKVFSLMIPIQSILSTSGSFFQVMNKPKLLFISGLLSALVNILAIALGVYAGELRYISYALVISFTLNFFQTYFFMFKYCFQSEVKEYYISLIRSLIVIAPSILIYGFLFYYVPSCSNHYVSLILNIILASLCCAVFIKWIRKDLSI